jgi:hypothetical protein
MTVIAKWREQRREATYKNIEKIEYQDRCVLLFKDGKITAVLPIDVYEYIREI